MRELWIDDELMVLCGQTAPSLEQFSCTPLRTPAHTGTLSSPRSGQPSGGAGRVRGDVPPISRRHRHGDREPTDPASNFAGAVQSGPARPRSSPSWRGARCRNCYRSYRHLVLVIAQVVADLTFQRRFQHPLVSCCNSPPSPTTSKPSSRAWATGPPIKSSAGSFPWTFSPALATAAPAFISAVAIRSHSLIRSYTGNRTDPAPAGPTRTDRERRGRARRGRVRRGGPALVVLVRPVVVPQLDGGAVAADPFPFASMIRPLRSAMGPGEVPVVVRGPTAGRTGCPGSRSRGRRRVCRWRRSTVRRGSGR